MYVFTYVFTIFIYVYTYFRHQSDRCIVLQNQSLTEMLWRSLAQTVKSNVLLGSCVDSKLTCPLTTYISALRGEKRQCTSNYSNITEWELARSEGLASSVIALHDADWAWCNSCHVTVSTFSLDIILWATNICKGLRLNF